MVIDNIAVTRCSGQPPPSSKPWKTFASRVDKFIQKTQEYVLQGIDPGGVYRAIWARDASYILKDWFLSGNLQGVLQQIYFIWSHQIEAKKEQKVVYGRGSPEMNFSSELANGEKLKEFKGALPTTIYQAGFSEVYGQSPDIDSTALMLSTTSWILTRTLKEEEEGSDLRDLPIQPIIAAEHSSDYISALLTKVGITDPSKVTDFVIPKMLKAIDYLISRDKDNDGLLEQDHNEDWMDTILRSGKIVYSQACWLLALIDFASLLLKVGREEDAQKLMTLTVETIQAVEEKLWSDNHGSYVDIQKNHGFEEPHRMLTQDISLYLVAITQNMITKQNNKVDEIQELKDIQHDQYTRAISTFDTMRSKLWNENWPLITDAELKASGPWALKQHEYHNQTFWPWISGIEMLARGRFNRIEECNILLSKIATKRPHIPAFYEWINPITHQPSGAFPFRTGISATRLALFDIIDRNNLYPR